MLDMRNHGMDCGTYLQLYVGILLDEGDDCGRELGHVGRGYLPLELRHVCRGREDGVGEPNRGFDDGQCLVPLQELDQ